MLSIYVYGVCVYPSELEHSNVLCQIHQCSCKLLHVASLCLHIHALVRRGISVEDAELLFGEEARQGNMVAAYHLAYSYENGEGVPGVDMGKNIDNMWSLGNVFPTFTPLSVRMSTVVFRLVIPYFRPFYV